MPQHPPGEPRSPPEPARPDGIDQLGLLPRFASVIAHELRNPLSAVKIALQTLERHAKLPVKDGTRLRIALREVATIERVLSEVLDWARPPKLDPAECTIGELCDAAIVLAGPELQERRVTVLRDPSSDALPIHVDRSRTTAALAALLTNGAQALPPGGSLQLGVALAGDFAELSVLDDGPGLTPDDQAHAFDPFYSSRARGVGLGLARARDLARAQGGDVVLSPGPAGGTRATLIVPRRSPGGHPPDPRV